MRSQLTAFLAVAGATFSQAVSVTPQVSYRSSIGVLGCKLASIDRFASFPFAPSCDTLCFRLTIANRTITVLHIDQSVGPHEISYEAWNQLSFGESTTTNPRMGSAVEMDLMPAPIEECADILIEGRLPFSATVGAQVIATCPVESFVRTNFILFNINTPTCTVGVDEPCSLDPIGVPSCPTPFDRAIIIVLRVANPVLDWVFGSTQRVPAA